MRSILILCISCMSTVSLCQSNNFSLGGILAIPGGLLTNSRPVGEDFYFISENSQMIVLLASSVQSL